MDSTVNIYLQRKEFWQHKDATVKSVVGDNNDCNLPDIKCSNELLFGLVRSLNLHTHYALDCAAGIGRVTQYVLTNYYDNVDLVEQDVKFINKAKELLANNNKVKHFYIDNIEKYDFQNKCKFYDLIWIQWCLENIENEDINNFINKCYNVLKDDGIVIVKENIYIEESDSEDNKDIKSKTDFSNIRPDIYYMNLFTNNGFIVYKHFLNPNWPEELIPLVVYVLKKK